MLANIILWIIIAIITYYQVVSSGLFGSLLMTVLTISSAIIALNYFEPLGNLINNLGLGFFGPWGIALIGLFSIILLILRITTHMILPQKIVLPRIIDISGACFFSLLTSLVVTGIIAIGVQTLPLPAQFLGFNRFPNLNQMEERKNLFPNSDGFLLGIMRNASNYCFAGRQRFGQHHPDLLQELYLNRLVLDAGSRREAGPGSITVKNTQLIKKPPVDAKTRQSLTLTSSESLLVVTVSINPGIRGKFKTGAADVDGMTRFVMGNFRLAGFNTTEHTSRGISQYPIGFLNSDGQTLEPLPLNEGRGIPAGGSSELELLFIWPANPNVTPPRYLEFKRSARADIPTIKNFSKT